MTTSATTALRALCGSLLAAGLLAAPVPALGAAPAQDGVSAVAEELRQDPVYVHPEARSELSSGEEARLEARIEDADKPVFVAVLPATDEFPPDTVLADLRALTGVTGVYAVQLGDGFSAGADSQVMSRDAVANLEGAVEREHEDATTQLTSFVDEALPQADGTAPASWDEGGTEGSGAAGLATLGGLLLAGGVGFYALRRRSRRREEERRRAELEKLRVVVDEDITAFGEELNRLDFRPGEPGADDAMRTDYTRALDAYEGAKEGMAGAREPRDVQPVTQRLAEGRFALATLDARRTGAPLPKEDRTPCFFDPRHGPSVTDVRWAPPGGTTRPVPACAADAERLAEGEEPDSRMVPTDRGPQPYWNAGPVYGPWAGGYFGGALLPGLLMGTMLGGMMTGPGAYGYGAGTDAAGGDVSGSDFSPGDFGGGGFGGDVGGFGGGDFGGGF
ncbi:hypothetical protein GCM10023347_42920 [Streptomyces chumphonensis]|uniref:Uncharacterized protein n=1 Tax=Streptomyces chumphonensis TaxID=1214925 RepID=A0A927F4G7_9ACTN|nr:hypothetical protein [Streptomyces chumphonensis]MBD3934131.1 hypothetical protein [Streptomyces chumphonensis]